ncbi:MAG: ABC transporter permease, partial [Anaerolineae bacterium]|nr:ABC transporter permease [Anaerolineae bacterium]
MSALRQFRGLSKKRRRGLTTGLLFISPWIVGFLVFQVYPFLASLYYSFTFYPALETPKFIGLGNFIKLAQDPRFLNSLYNSAYYAIIAVPLGALTG